METGAFNSIADIMELKRKLDDAGLVRQHKNDEIDKLKAGIEIGKSLIDERDEIIAGYVAELNSIRDKIAPTNISYLMEMVEHQKNTINRMKEKNAELSNDRKIYINKSNDIPDFQSSQTIFINITYIIVNPRRNNLVAIHAFPVPVDVRVLCFEDQGTPAIINLHIHPFHKGVIAGPEIIIYSVTVGCKDVGQFIIDAIVHAYNH